MLGIFDLLKNLNKEEEVVSESLRSENEDNIVETDAEGYTLIELDQMELGDGRGGHNETFSYIVLKPNDYNTPIAKWNSFIDALALPLSEYKKSMVRRNFRRAVNDEKAKQEANRKQAAHNYYGQNSRSQSALSWLYSDDDYTDPNYEARQPSYLRSTSLSYDRSYGNWASNCLSEEEAMKKYNNSDTLVLHKSDPSTTMLKQIYEGKGWDVINNVFEISHPVLHKLLESHERIVLLGHGTGYGLIGSIEPSCAPFLKDKKLFVIWCNADQYFNRNLPEKKGFFCTKNAPSEKWECSAAGCGNISEELMLENITYWCKLCGDVCEACLEGNVDASVDYIRKNYLEKYGNHPVSIFNADSAHNQGYERPLPEWEFKGEKLEPKDYPYPGYNEEEFLKNPVPYINK